MDAVDFLKNLGRMCSKFEDCVLCPCYDTAFCDKPPSSWQSWESPLKMVQVVEKWSAEHPCRTRQSEFLKHYPNAEQVGGIITICSKDIDIGCSCPDRADANCPDCRRDFWSEEVE